MLRLYQRVVITILQVAAWLPVVAAAITGPAALGMAGIATLAAVIGMAVCRGIWLSAGTPSADSDSEEALRKAKVAESLACLAALPDDAAAAQRRATAQAVKGKKQQCTHEFVQHFGGEFSCACCWEPITDAGRLAAETEKMEAALAEDGADDDHADCLWSRGVTVAWLLTFTKEHDCWEWTTTEVQALIIKPATDGGRQRYADLPEVRAAAGVGPADVFVSREFVLFLFSPPCNF